MPNREFKASSGLVEKVARKQSGVIEKAWLEAVMNSVDAGATEVNLRMEESWTDISDNGSSMTRDEVEQYFEHFGLEDEDIEDKEFGKFRIGRGQIFNFGVNIWRAKENYMIVSLDEDQTTVSLDECTTTDDDSIISVEESIYEVNTEGLSYALLDAEPIEEGLSIHLQHYNNIEDLESTISEFKKLARYVSWVHDVVITVNGEEVGEEPQVITETDNAWYVEADDKHTNRSVVYNKGARVDEFRLGPRRMGIITKKDLDVTLDRTDILDTDQYWAAIKAEYEDVIIEDMLDDDDLSKKERNWLIEEASENAQLIQLIADKPLLDGIDGDLWTITELSNKKVGFAQRDDTIAEDANEQPNVLMLREHHEESLTEFVNSAQETISESDIKTYSEIVDENLAFEMDKVDEESLSKRRRTNLRRLRRALRDLGFIDGVRAGYSNHKKYWKDDEGTLFIHKEQLNKSKGEINTTVFFDAVRVAAHDGDTRAGMNEDFSLNRNFYRITNGESYGADVNFPEAQRKLMAGDYK